MNNNVINGNVFEAAVVKELWSITVILTGNLNMTTEISIQ